MYSQFQTVFMRWIMKGGYNRHLIFSLNEQSYGIKVDGVIKVVMMVEITPLPGAPASVSGVINFQGSMIPVLNLRWHFGLPEKPISLPDHLVIASFSGQVFGIVIDRVLEVREVTEETMAEGFYLLPGPAFPSGVTATLDGVILIDEMGSLLPPVLPKATS